MENSIPPELARKLLTKDFANLVQRVQRGGKMSRTERSMLQNMAAGSVPEAGPLFVKNFVELAGVLGVTRQSLNKWKKIGEAPESKPNGLHEVAAWREFMHRHDFQSTNPATDEETALRARKLLAEVEERELKVAVRKGLYVTVEEVRRTWTTQIGRATALLRNKFESELPPILSGLDATGIQEECRKAIDEVLTVLHEGGV